MEQWEKNYYISSLAGATNGSSLVVMSKGVFSSFIVERVQVHTMSKHCNLNGLKAFPPSQWQNENPVVEGFTFMPFVSR